MVLGWLKKLLIEFPWFLSINKECSNASSLYPLFPSKPEHPVQNLRARHMVKKTHLAGLALRRLSV
jgi:hypothetical protein